MKKIFIGIIGFLFFSATTVYGQSELVLKNGQYYTSEKELYKGQYSNYHKNGATEATYSLENGVLNGKAQFLYKDGSKKEIGFYKDGDKHGEWIKWNEKDHPVRKANYHYGNKDGKWVIWDDKGQKRYEIYYNRGEKIGTWKMWSETGELVSEKEQ